MIAQGLTDGLEDLLGGHTMEGDLAENISCPFVRRQMYDLSSGTKKNARPVLALTIRFILSA